MGGAEAKESGKEGCGEQRQKRVALRERQWWKAGARKGGKGGCGEQRREQVYRRKGDESIRRRKGG